MGPRLRSRKNLLAIITILAGLGAISVALAADLLGIGGYTGFGIMQIILLIFGLVVLLIGVLQQYNFDWHKLFAVSGPTVSSTQLLLMAVWFGLLTGMAEGLMFVVGRWLIQRVPLLNPDLFWMKPVANLILFAGIALVLLLVVRPWLKAIPIRLATCIFIFLGFTAQIFLFPQVHRIAALVLAAGLGIQFSRWVAGHAAGFLAAVRRSILWVVGFSAALGLSVYAWKVVPEYQALAKLPPARPGLANVLLIVLDTVRASSLSVYGYSRPTTPQLEKWAKTGVRFENALSTSPWTLPSHGTMFTGRFPHELFADGATPLNGGSPIGSTYPTLAEVLSDHGYVTGGFVANLRYCSHAYGLARGFAHYDDYFVSLQSLFVGSSLGVEVVKKMRRLLGWRQRIGKTAGDVNQAFLDWLGDHDQRPFFAFLNYFDAHTPYIPPEPFELKFGTKKPSMPNIRHNYEYKTQEIEPLRDAYDSCIAYLDNEIGSLLDQLDDRGVLNNTLVIVTSDHGEQFGEHGLMFHGNSLYRALLDVPLLILFPARVPAGDTVPETVSLRDLPATVVDLLGLENNVFFPGSSLRRYWDNLQDSSDARTRTHLSEVLVGDQKPNFWAHTAWPSHKGSRKSLVADGYHYIENGDGSEELYDFERDREELRNLSNSQEGRRLLDRFRLFFETELAQSGKKSSFETGPLTGDKASK
ncbi:MAG: DUF229 domain-containing protein [Caldithrix sp.]|nr:MAG: DUF229 domain-containing protein [Caldithrix sp.]